LAFLQSSHSIVVTTFPRLNFGNAAVAAGDLDCAGFRTRPSTDIRAGKILNCPWTAEVQRSAKDSSFVLPTITLADYAPFIDYVFVERRH
jgi:hypothetical protein